MEAAVLCKILYFREAKLGKKKKNQCTQVICEKKKSYNFTRKRCFGTRGKDKGGFGLWDNYI